MRFKATRCVRLMTITVPFLWFAYVFYSAFLLDVNNSVQFKDPLYVEAQTNKDSGRDTPADAKPSHDKVQGGLGNRNNDLIPHLKLSGKKTREKDKDIRLKDVRPDNAAEDKLNNSRIHAEEREDNDDPRDSRQEDDGVETQALDQRSIREKEVESLAPAMQAQGLKPAIHSETDAGKHGDDKEDGHAEVNPFNVEDNVARHDVDLYADVTYPPYVERLPAGSRGGDEKGVLLDPQTLTWEQQVEYNEKWNKNFFNQYVSDLIPVHRELPDFRSKSCQERQYPSDLPALSVVIVFHNEAWSVLLRSVHSILDRTPPHLLQQVVLVDDFSSMDHLKRPLEKYFRDYRKVTIVKAPKRGGLTKARLLGFQASTSEVVVFLDSHIECSTGWAEPLLWAIYDNYRTVPFPNIDHIHPRHLSVTAYDSSRIGGLNMDTLTFTWGLTLNRERLPGLEAKPSPTMPGGLFAISRRWFEELGTYDPELEYWGGENMELSFKAWMCGGSIVIAECSHIGHIFRSQNPIQWSTPLGQKNYVRVAMVWMDEYKNHYLERINYKVGRYGDISDRLAVRDRLKCHDFGWYIDNVYPELKSQIVMNATYAGEFRHQQSGLCLDEMDPNKDNPKLFACHHLGGRQFWYLKDEKYIYIANKYLCITPKGSVNFCHDNAREEWSYNSRTQQLVSLRTGQCLQTSTKGTSLYSLIMSQCQDSSESQKWILERRREFQYK